MTRHFCTGCYGGWRSARCRPRHGASSIGLEDTPWPGWRPKTVWATPRWRSALKVAPRRRTRTLTAPRWCHVTDLAPRRRRLSGQRRGGARVRWRHHDGALPLSWRQGGIGLSGQCHDGAVPRTLRHGGTRARWLHHGGVLPLKWCHVGAGLFGRRRGGALPRRPRHDGALPRRPRHDGARVRSRHHDGALPLSPRHVGAEMSGQAPRWRLAVGGRPRMCICPPQDCMSGPGRGPGRLAGGVGPA